MSAPAADFLSFEARLQATTRGQAFLDWISHKALVSADVPSMRAALRDLHSRVNRTQAEIRGLRTAPRPGGDLRDAQTELEEIVRETESAAGEILGAAERIQGRADALRQSAPDQDALCAELDEVATQIFMACSFQDITGQRVAKVVQALAFVRTRVDGISHAWNLPDEVAPANPADPDSALLNGPARSGSGLSQADIDFLLVDAEA